VPPAKEGEEESVAKRSGCGYIPWAALMMRMFKLDDEYGPACGAPGARGRAEGDVRAGDVCGDRSARTEAEAPPKSTGPSSKRFA
jgi:hypothetical protein